jgi:endogenous inhibitor of DNA gyrase (YacG/DUF329 family)
VSTQACIPCPRCGSPAVFAPSNRWRPFCSERCKLIDLGNWASERYRVPEEPGAEKDEESERA